MAPTRRWNAARLDGYVAALDAGRRVGAALPPGGSETVDAETAAAERVILGLRLDTGVPFAAANEPPLADAFGWALTAELVERDAGRPRRPDDPRPPALQRAVQPPRLTDARVAGSSLPTRSISVDTRTS